MLKIENLYVNYGGIEAVKGISLDVPDGSIITLVGANGAGKSTTLRAIVGLVKARSGSITLDGEELLGMDTTDIVAKGVTMVPEGRRVFPDMTVLENLKIGAYLRKDNLKDDIERVYALFPRLKERSWQAAGTLSGGEQQMLAVGRALMSRPDLLLSLIHISAADKDPIKIGVYLPLTGQNAFGGQLELEGVRLAQKEMPTVLDLSLIHI